MSDKGITLEGLAAAVDALREELATWKALAHKQDALTAAQITATQSGATAAKIDQIATNAAAIVSLTSSKQDTLSTAQLAAVNSGITSAAVQQISTNATDIATKAADSAVVHLAGAETITGDKTFTGAVVTHDVTPETDGTYSLGSSSYQWASVYAQTYYYNGTQWGLDKANVWTGENTFSSTLKQVNSTVTKGTIPQSDTTAFSVYWGGTDISSLNNALFAQRGYVNADGSTTYILYALENAIGGTLTLIGIKYDPNDTVNKRYAYLRGDFRPYADNSFNLGTSTNKWKTLNGINPGALSLPDMNTSTAVDTTGWTYDGATFNEIKINNATQTISGWLYTIINNAAADDVIVVRYAGSDSSNLTYAQYKSGLSYVSLVAPIMPGVKTYVASRKAFSAIKIYPCLGNV